MLFAFSSGLLTPVSDEMDMGKQNDVLRDAMECLKKIGLGLFLFLVG
jgi:hypothetical protein